MQCQSRLQEMKLIGVPISTDEFDCYKIIHAILRDNKLELICTLRELNSNQLSISVSQSSFTENILFGIMFLIY